MKRIYILCSVPIDSQVLSIALLLIAVWTSSASGEPSQPARDGAVPPANFRETVDREIQAAERYFSIQQWDDCREAALDAAASCRQLIAAHGLLEEIKQLAGDLARRLSLLGRRFQQQQDYLAAAVLRRESLTLRRKVFGPEHPSIASELNSLASVYRSQGNWERSRRHAAEAVGMLRRLGVSGIPLASCLNSYGLTLRELGDYALARTQFAAALDLLREHYQGDHLHVATMLNNLGLVLEWQGDFAEAERYYDQAVNMMRRLEPEGGRKLAMTLHSLGGLYESIGEWDQARARYLEALEMRAEIQPREHPELATILSSLGMLAHDQGQFPASQAYHERALAVRRVIYPQASYPSGHPKLARTLENLGDLYWAKGDYDQAQQFYLRTLRMRELLYPHGDYPHGHPDLADSFDDLGKLYLSRHQYQQSREYSTKALAMRQSLADLLLLTASEAEALNFLATQDRSRDQLLSIPTTEATQGDLYHAIWSGRRLIHRRMARRLAVAHVSGSGVVEEYQDVRRQLARLSLTPAADDPATNASRKQMLMRLSRQKEALERQLPQQAGTTFSESTPADLAARLPQHAVFVDFVRHMDRRFDPNRPGRRGETRAAAYSAFVVAPGQPARRIPVGRAERVDQLVERWREEIARGGMVGSQIGLALRREVWEPVAETFPAAAQTIHICCDAALTGVPWHALPGERPQSALLEDYLLGLVPSGQFLLASMTDVGETPSARSQARPRMLLLGDVAYDQAEQPPAAVSAAAFPPRLRALPRDMIFGALPGTLQEITEIEKLARLKDYEVELLRGRQATGDRVLAELPQAHYAHLATHGFFVSSPPQEMGARSAVSPERRDRHGALARNPLVLSGLAFAGANQRGPDSTGGYVAGAFLTAEEIAALPLHSLRVVVLSACRTGLGQAANGEGLYGLQRSFHIAGVENVAASLWDIPDRATAALMGLFYRRLWQGGDTPLEALRHAQLALYQHPELIQQFELVEELAQLRSPDLQDVAAIGTAPSRSRSSQRVPIQTWASFILSGSGR